MSHFSNKDMLKVNTFDDVVDRVPGRNYPIPSAQKSEDVEWIAGRGKNQEAKSWELNALGQDKIAREFIRSSKEDGYADDEGEQSRILGKV